MTHCHSGDGIERPMLKLIENTHDSYDCDKLSTTRLTSLVVDPSPFL